MSNNLTIRKDTQFQEWVALLKSEIQRTQIKAAVRVNSELLHLYWRIGHDICEKQRTAMWGDGFLRILSEELTSAFPNIKGFSLRNLKYVRQWYLFYNQDDIIGQQVVAQLGDGENNDKNQIDQQAVGQLGEDENNDENQIGQQVVGQLQKQENEVLAILGERFFEVPWGHHLYIMSQCKDVGKALKPDHLGQLGLYVSAVNHAKKKPEDKPTIGLLICKTKNDVMAQYTLETTSQPIGISEYTLSKLIPEHLKSSLPDIEEIEAALTNK